MTLIVGFRAGAAGFMFGDLLLSSDAAQATAVAIPTRFDSRQPAVDARIVRLSQNVILVNKQLAIAWAGNYLVARHIARAAIAAQSFDIFFGKNFEKFILSLDLSEVELRSVSMMF